MIQYDKTNKLFPSQKPESDYGNREYKRHLLNQDKLNHLATQLLFRLQEGNGKAVYIIGIENNGNNKGIDDNELDISIKSIKKIVNIINANIINIKIYKGQKGKIATVRVYIPDYKPNYYLSNYLI